MSKDRRTDPDEIAQKLAKDQREERLRAIADRVCGDDFAVAALIRALGASA